MIIECTYDIVRDVAKVDLGWRVTRNENFNSEWDVYFADLGIDSEHLAQMKPYQKINHFPQSFELTRKDRLILPQELNDLRYYTQNYYKKQSNMCPQPGAPAGKD